MFYLHILYHFFCLINMPKDIVNHFIKKKWHHSSNIEIMVGPVRKKKKEGRKKEKKKITNWNLPINISNKVNKLTFIDKRKLSPHMSSFIYLFYYTYNWVYN